MVQAYVSSHNLRVPLVRIDGSKYLFGTKITMASILNGALTVRVGGGFMTLDDLVAQHSDNEANKLLVLSAKQNKKATRIVQDLAGKYRSVEKKKFL